MARRDPILVREPTAEATLAEARRILADGHQPLVRPDPFFEADGELDLDLWLAYTATLLVEGIEFETRHDMQQQRLTDMHAAIISGTIAAVEPPEITE